MRPALAQLAALCCALSAHAQDVPVTPVVPDGGAVIGDRLWSIDLLLGLPTGVRVQRAFDDHVTNRGWEAEGFLGLEIIIPTIGGGLRRKTGLGGILPDEFFVAPGVDAYLMLNPDQRLLSGDAAHLLLTGDIDIGWRHPLSRGGSGEFGVKLGAGVWLGTDNGGVLPVVAMFGGWHF
jgi:hypothetical protein